MRGRATTPTPRGDSGRANIKLVTFGVLAGLMMGLMKIVLHALVEAGQPKFLAEVLTVAAVGALWFALWFAFDAAIARFRRRPEPAS